MTPALIIKELRTCARHQFPPWMMLNDAYNAATRYISDEDNWHAYLPTEQRRMFYLLVAEILEHGE